MLPDMIKKISVSAHLPEGEVQKMIEEKRLELAGMVSQEGAAYIVAKELGVQLLRRPERLKLNAVVPGMQNVDIVAKVQRIFPAREFSTPKAKGKVMNVILADETSTARLSLWNEEVTRYNDISEGDVLHVSGYVKEDNTGGPEIRLGRFGVLQKSDEQIAVPSRRIERVDIAELREGQAKQVRAMIISVFDSDFFFNVCPVCNASLKGSECADHGIVEPKKRLVVSGIIDDGTENMRFVSFGDAAEKIAGHKTEDLAKADSVIERIEIGRELVFDGRVRRNTMFNRLEFIVNDANEPDVKKEIENLLENG